MFAVVKTGGKQYRVEQNNVILVEKLSGDVGATIDLDNVLMVGDKAKVKVGAPFVKDAKVTATIVDQTRGDKVIIFKKKRRHTYRRKNGHRQDLTVLRINQIAG